MVTSSGIVLPGEAPLACREVAEGLYIAVNSYERDAGYFGQSPLYPKEQPAPAAQPPAKANAPAESASK
jgi:hypothetical protein